MKTKIYCLFTLILFFAFDGKAQVSSELQDAINNIPIVSFAYPENRDRNQSLQVNCPQSFVFAYYQLPYAIDLRTNLDAMSGLYIDRVMVRFNSVDMSSSQEKRLLANAILKLQNLQDRQYTIARIAGFNNRTNFSRSMLSRYASNGNVLIALREIMSTQDLINKLVNRANDI